MKIFIDADACPVVDIIMKVAKEYKIPVTIVCDTAHFVERTNAETIVVQKGIDAVDFVITNKVSKGDIVVTQDYGLAAMILAKRGYPINQNGLLYTENNIEQLLFRRHVAQVVRKKGGRTKGPRKRTNEDNDNFEREFKNICKKLIK
ncbi:MAG: YaiI/YqxD family protein [Cellulosilyticaceae bacterium]